LVRRLPYSRPIFDILPSSLTKYFDVHFGSRQQRIPESLTLPPIRIAVTRYRIGDPEQSWLATAADQFNHNGISLSFYEKEMSFFDKSHLENPFWVVRFIPSSRDPIALFNAFRVGGSWITSTDAVDDDEYLRHIREGRATVSTQKLGRVVEQLSDLYAEQVRG